MLGLMYHTSIPCTLQVPLLCGLVRSSTLVPDGTSGVALKSKFPINAAYAERDGFLLDHLNRFIVSFTCGMR